MEKERLFYLDFIRAVAVIVIVLTHYNAVFLYMPVPMPEKCILSAEMFNIYIGNLGVSLFFIISGAALMYTYENKMKMKDFFIKRFWGIYPMWWLSYIIVLSYWFLKYKTYNPWQVNRGGGWKILLSFIGFDRYFEGITPVFGFVGEWFLGCIILLYCLFPVLRIIVIKVKHYWPVVLFLAALYFGGIYRNITPLHSSILPWVRIPEFLFGMFFIRYCKSFNITKGAFLSVIILTLNLLLKPTLNDSIQTTYIGIASFVCLVWSAKRIKNVKLIHLCSEKLCKYSYSIFLIHHVIINEVVKGFDMAQISRMGNLILFFVIFEIVIVLSMGLYYMSQKIITVLKTSV